MSGDKKRNYKKPTILKHGKLTMILGVSSSATPLATTD